MAGWITRSPAPKRTAFEFIRFIRGEAPERQRFLRERLGEALGRAAAPEGSVTLAGEALAATARG